MRLTLFSASYRAQQITESNQAKNHSLRRPEADKPTNPLPNNHTTPGNGTADTALHPDSEPTPKQKFPICAPATPPNMPAVPALISRSPLNFQLFASLTAIFRLGLRIRLVIQSLLIFHRLRPTTPSIPSRTSRRQLEPALRRA